MSRHLYLGQQSSRSNRQHDDSKELQLLQQSYFQAILNKELRPDPNAYTTFYEQFLQKLGQVCTPFSLCCRCCFSFPLYQQQTGELGLLQRFGKYVHNVEPGLMIINPITQRVVSVNLKTHTLAFEQQIITRDNVQVKIQSVVFLRTYEPENLAYKLGTDLAYIRQCVSEISKACLRFVAGGVELQQLIQKRQLVAKDLAQQINKQVKIWGIFIQKCSIKEFHLHPQIRQSLSKVATTKRKIKAMLINSKANVESAKLLKQVSQILDNKAAMQIRYLQAIESILENNNDNIIIIKTNLKDK